MLTRIRRVFRRSPKVRAIPPGNYTASVVKVSVDETNGCLRIEFAVPGFKGHLFYTYFTPRAWREK